MTLVRTAAALMAATFALGALAAGNTTNEDFRDSKKMLERKVYFDHRVTLYCGYAFDKQKNVSLPAGFVAPQHKERAGRVEWEHVVPAENFGRAFKEWREGDGRCTNEKGHFYKGRRCAEKMSRGEIARAMLYMEGAYAPVFRMSDRQRRLAQNWNEQHPVVQWECTRAARIEKLQGNVNPVVKDACLKAGLTYRP